MEEKSEKNGALSLIWNFVTTFVTAFAVMVAAALVIGRAAGCRMLSIESGSMSPAYPVNALVVTMPADFEDIAVGDVISYVLDESGTTVTHRVVEKNDANQTFVTKGDANDIEDAEAVYYENVIGRVFICIPGLGSVLRILTEETDKRIIIGVIIAVLCVSFGSDIYKGLKNRERKKEDVGEAEGSEEDAE